MAASSRRDSNFACGQQQQQQREGEQRQRVDVALPLLGACQTSAAAAAADQAPHRSHTGSKLTGVQPDAASSDSLLPVPAAAAVHARRAHQFHPAAAWLLLVCGLMALEAPAKCRVQQRATGAQLQDDPHLQSINHGREHTHPLDASYGSAPASLTQAPLAIPDDHHRHHSSSPLLTRLQPCSITPCHSSRSCKPHPL